jgi:hypothetical protein
LPITGVVAMTAVSEVRAPVRIFIRTFLLTIVSVGLLAGLALRVMNYEMRRDEQLYVPPIKLLDSYQLYTDFFYNHVPGSAWFFHFIALVSGSDHLLAVGRSGVLFAWIVMIAAIAGVVFVLTRSALVAWCAVVLALANETFLTQPGMTATNNFLPLPLSFLGLGFFVIGLRVHRAAPALIALGGVCLALAAAIKISAVAFIPAVVVAAFLLPRNLYLGERFTRCVAPLAAGGVIGGLPLLIPLLSDSSRFLAHVVGYHTGPHLAFWRTDGAADEGAAIGIRDKVLLGYDVLLTGAVTLAVAAVVILVLMALHMGPDRRRVGGATPWELVFVVLGAAACALVMSFLPTPSFPQYYAPPLISLPLLIGLLYTCVGFEGRRWAETVLLGLAVVTLAVGMPRLVQDVAKANRPGSWTVNRVHQAGLDIARRLEAAGVTGKVATLAPIYPLEGGLPVYLELATGPFAYRTADLTPPELARFYRQTSPTTVTALFEADPPAALLLGFNEKLEQPMKEFAERRGYTPVTDLGIEDRYGTPVLYVRPPGG